MPFLNHHVVELALSIKGTRKISIYTMLLKQTVRGLIPDEVIDKKSKNLARI